MSTPVTPVCAGPSATPPTATAILIQLDKFLGLKKDRKDRTTKAYYDHETALANDMKVAGVRNPIKAIEEVVEGITWYRPICGQTRIFAARRAGLLTIPTILLQGSMTETRLLCEELADNNMTEGFDALAQADIFLTLMKENGWTQAELCANVPIAKPPMVSKSLSIFENLIEELKAKLRVAEIGPRIAYKLSLLPPEKQAATYEKVKHMKVAAAEEHITAELGGKKLKPKPTKFKIGGTRIETTTLETETFVTELQTAINTALAAKKAGVQNPVKNVPQFLKAS